MDDDLDDDFFPDDIDLDHLPANALNELEQRAFFSTQTRPQAPDAGPTSSDYGLEDEDVVDLDAQQNYGGNKYANAASKFEDKVTQREQWRLQRYASKGEIEAPIEQRNNGGLHESPFNDHELAEPFKSASRYGAAQNRAPSPVQELDVSALQARINELEQERIALQKSATDARSAALAKAGEIAIVRANHDKTTKDYERRIVTIQQSHLEEIKKQRIDLEAAKRDREKVETNNRFLEHDLAQEAERARNMKKTLSMGHGNVARSRVPAQPSPLSTPRKDRYLPFRDGFDDDEVVMISPSKPKVVSRPATPKAGLKRKRLFTAEHSQSPGQMLPLAEPERSPHEGAAVDPFQIGVNQGLPIHPTAADEKLCLMQSILDHHSDPRRARTMELMANYKFPSAPSNTFSSMIFDMVNLGLASQSAEEFCLEFCNVLLQLWSKCLREKYHVPLRDLVELLQFTLKLSSSKLSNSLITRIVPLCLTTADVIALPRAKASKNKSLAGALSDELNQQINPLDYLKFLHQLALDSYPEDDVRTNFWTSMDFELVLLMLNKAQPIVQITEMLQLLATSILPSSFGSISALSGPQQSKNESDILDRLTNLLFETPLPLSRETRYSPIELADLRTAVLSLIQNLAYTSHGGNLLATHRLAIGRFVRFLHEAILTLYIYRPLTHAATTLHINITVYILAHLTSTHADVIDLRAKLAAVPSGPQKHLVSLSRVAFAEGYSVIERGIEGEAAEAAHRMLDELLSPEEGEAVVEVFSSAR